MGDSRDSEGNFDPAPPSAPLVFISHHSSQVEIARHLKRALSQQGIGAWMAPDDVPYGASFDEAITTAIDDSDAIVLLFSAAADQSRHVKRELVLADNEGVPILPLRTEAVEPVQLRYWLQTSQWVDWMDRRDEVLARLAKRVRAIADGAAGQAADLSEEVLTEAAETHPMNIASRRNGVLAALFAAALVLAGVGWAIWSGAGNGAAASIEDAGRFEGTVWAQMDDLQENETFIDFLDANVNNVAHLVLRVDYTTPPMVGPQNAFCAAHEEGIDVRNSGELLAVLDRPVDALASTRLPLFNEYLQLPIYEEGDGQKLWAVHSGQFFVPTREEYNRWCYGPKIRFSAARREPEPSYAGPGVYFYEINGYFRIDRRLSGTDVFYDLVEMDVSAEQLRH